MANVTATNGNLFLSDPYAESGTTNAVLGKEAFLNLLVTQLTNQDPLEPMENTEFVAQLAQFSSLEQLWNVNGNLEANVLLTQSLQNSLMSSLIDQDVRLAGDAVILNESGEATLYYTLAADAVVTIEILGEDGEVVRTLELGQLSAGDNRYYWNGEDNYGKSLDPGVYSYRVSAVDQDGNDVYAQLFTVGMVTGVRFSDGIPILLIGEFPVSPAEIVEFGHIHDAEDTQQKP